MRPDQALEETFLIARLAVALYSYLGLGTRWTGKLLRLILYSALLLPGFIQARTPCRASQQRQLCRWPYCPGAQACCVPEAVAAEDD